MAIEIAIRNRVGELELDVSFQSRAGVIALFGPSGAGKTSIVNIIAGLLRPDYARIVIAGEVICDTDAQFSLPAHKRRLGLVFQDTRLFPHLSVAGNLDYGAWFSNTVSTSAERSMLIELLGLQKLLARRPSQLSGGEKQRVAIARAVLSRPRLLIMDEPLASLDGPRKEEILAYLENLRDRLAMPVLYVSHSRKEIARLAGDVAVLDHGKLTRIGAPSVVLGS